MKKEPALPAEISYGGDYNPEQWPEEVWLEDVRLMKQAGVNLVSLGIFSWSKIEPREGEFDFEWLDRVMNLLNEHGVGVDLATATASTPAWFVRKYPDSLPVMEDGTNYSFGGRQHYCPNHPGLIERIKVLVRAISSRYKDHPALKMWHINNEYACHISACYCENCAQSFREWLKRRYGSIEELNERWGTSFWSQRYGGWEEINPPRKAPTFPNPSQQLDYKRFMNDSFFHLFLTEKKILRENTPDIPITTNFMGPFKPLNYFEWAEEVDVVSWDSYPDPADGIPATHAMMNDLMRSLKKGKPFLLMEQVTSQVNWRSINVPKPPGVMRLWSYATIARGADGILFFQWRQSKAGAEKFHGAMIPHSNDEESRVYREVQQLGNELKQMKSMIGSRIEPRVAIVFDWENWWAVELDSKPHNELNYIERVFGYYKELYKRNIPVDFVRAGDPLSQYDLVIAPMLYMLKQDEAENLKEFTANGGTLVVSYFSGIVDENDLIHLGGYPAPLKELLGLTVEEFIPFGKGKHNTVLLHGERAQVSMWADFIRLEGAEPLGTFENDWYAGSPALTSHAFGGGRAIYIGTELESQDLGNLLEKLMDEEGIDAPLEAPAHIEVLERSDGREKHLVLINHNHEEVELTLPKDKRFQDLIHQTELIEPLVRIKGIDVAVLKEI